MFYFIFIYYHPTDNPNQQTYEFQYCGTFHTVFL